MNGLVNMEVWKAVATSGRKEALDLRTPLSLCNIEWALYCTKPFLQTLLTEAIATRRAFLHTRLDKGLILMSSASEEMREPN